VGVVMMRDNKADLRRVDELIAAVEAARAAHVRRLIRARYSATCDVCGEPVAVGDVVAWRPSAAPTHVACFKGELAGVPRG
jgi:hypothetical protein